MKIEFFIPKGDRPNPYDSYPPPKYEAGTRFQRTKHSEGSDLVWCTVGKKIWYDEGGQGWVYEAIADEPVLMYDDWTPNYTTKCSASDKELDGFFNKKPD